MDIVEFAYQQVLACLAETGIAELDGVRVEVGNVSDVEQLGDYQVSQVFDQLLTLESNSLRVERENVLVSHFSLDLVDVLVAIQVLQDAGDLVVRAFVVLVVAQRRLYSGQLGDWILFEKSQYVLATAGQHNSVRPIC